MKDLSVKFTIFTARVMKLDCFRIGLVNLMFGFRIQSSVT
jgi:hypothetical protein